MVAAFYPLQFVTERIGGDAVTVTNLTKPGAEPHDLELNPRQVGAIVDAELIVYLNGFQPAVDDGRRRRTAADRAFDVAGRRAAARRRQPARTRATPGTSRRQPARTRTSGSTRPGWPPSATSSPSGSAQADPAHAADFTARAAALRAELAEPRRGVRRAG